jgi:dTDP-4-dehydrorhamnose reductase
MKILLVGANGKIGRAWRRLADTWPLQTLTAFPPSSEADLTTHEGIQKLSNEIRGSSYDLVIHAAAWTNVDRCEREPETADVINTRSVASVADACKQMGAGLIFYSSDYVFDGSGPKDEQAQRSPLNIYGETKVQAEDAIRESCAEHLIIRINAPFAPPADGLSFYSFVFSTLSSGGTVRAVVDQWNNPLDTDRIALWSHDAWEKQSRGVFHLAGGTYATRYDLARAIAQYIEIDTSRIQPVHTSELNQVARRPTRGGLIASKQARLFGTAPDIQTVLRALPKSI